MDIREVICYGSNKWSDLKPLDIKDPKLYQLKWNKYVKSDFSKKQFVIHHTVSGPGTRGDLATWKKNKSKIGTFAIGERNGKIAQLFNSSYHAYHLGCGNIELDRHSIAYELDNWGQLYERDGILYNIYNTQVKCDIVRYQEGFRGERIFEAYTYEQLRSLGEVLLLMNKKYGIPLDYNDDMWDVSERALKGKPGIWAHVSFRESGKWDAHPDPNLISMLKTLKSIA